jgi:hypothetical protein
MERCAIGNDVTGSHVIGSDVTGSDVSHVTGRDVSHVTGSDVITRSDVIFPALFCYYDLRFLIIPLVFFGHCVVCHSSYGFCLFL